MNMHISQKHIYLLIIVVVAIVLFSLLRGPREGFNNYMASDTSLDEKKLNQKQNMNASGFNQKQDMNASGFNQKQHNNASGFNQTQDDNASGFNQKQDYNKYKLDNFNGSYIAPAGDTVLYDEEEPQHRPTKKCRHKKHSKNGPLGIPRCQIPDGDEDLYILKSEVVPPVCPACPNVTACSTNKAPPPCPPCARCPEPAFDCKKVPNYNSSNSEYLPRPVLADFSQFGM